MSVAFEVGRVIVKTAGRELARKGIILGFVDKNFILLTGAGISGVRRRKANLKHVLPLDKKIDIKENASEDDVLKAVETANLKDFLSEEHDFSV